MRTKKKKYALGYPDTILLLLFAVFICAVTTSKIIEDDVFIHLVTGKYIVENKTVPSADVFCYISNGVRWIPYEWAWQAATYLVWKAGDYTLLSIFRTLIILFIFVVYFLILNKLKIPLPLFIVPGALMCIGLCGRFVIRPHIISYLCFAALVSVFFYYKFSGYKHKFPIYLLPLLFLIWANIHMGVILGIGIFVMFLFSETVTYKGKRGIFRKSRNIPSPGDLKLLYTVFLLSFASVFINPHFAGTYLYVYDMFNIPELKYINEWASPFESSFISGYYVSVYFIFLVLGISILVYSYKTREIFPALLYIVLGIFSTKSLRYTSDFIVIIFIPLLVSLNYCFRNFKLSSNIIKSRAALAAVCIAMVFLIVNTFNNRMYRFLDIPFRETGFGVSEKYFPVQLVDFMTKEKVCETGNNPFNSMRIGGYFLWSFEGEKNFADNRCLSSRIMNEYFDIDLCKEGFKEKMKHYKIDYIVLDIPNFNSMLIEIEYNLAAYLSKNPEWKLIYWNDSSFLFVRNEEKFRDLISRYGYKYVTPVNSVYHRDLIAAALKNDSKTVNRELGRRSSEDKDGIIINGLINYLNMNVRSFSISK